MTQQDLLELLALVQAQLRDVGKPEIADEDRFARVAPEATTPLSAKDLMIDMLASFDRSLAMQDRRTYTVALEKINESLVAPTLEGVEVEPGLTGLQSQAIRLSETPDLTKLRIELRHLVALLRREEFSGEPG